MLWAGEFIRRLCSPYGKDGIKKIPKEVREEARCILRHFPLPGDLMYANTAFDAEAVTQFLDSKTNEEF